MPISVLVYYIFQIVLWLLFLSVLLTWIPNIDWEKPFFKFLRTLSEMFFGPFRRIIPPIGGLDWSPIIVFLVLQFCAGAIVNALRVMGL